MIAEKKKQMVPQLRFSEFDGEWERKKLGELAVVKRGAGSQYIDYINNSKDGIRLIRIGDFLGSEAVYVKKTNEIQRFLLNPNDILIAGTGATAGITFLIPEEFVGHAYSYNAPKITVIDSNEKFITFYLKCPIITRQQQRLFTGNAQPFLDTKSIRNFKISIPKLQEQQKIASFLTAVDKKLQQLTTKKEKLEHYKKGVMQQLFSQQLRFKDEDGNDFPDWEEKRFKEIIIDYRLGGNYQNTLEKTDYPLIKMGNLDRGKVKLDKIEYITSNESVDRKDKIEYGDLFFNTRNTLDLVGKVAIWRNELPVAYYNSNLMYLKFENNFFMNFRLNSYEGIKALKRFATGTTSVAAIYTKDLLKLKLNIPSLKEQQKIAVYLSALDAKIEIVAGQIEKTKEFKKGLLQQLFV